MALLLTLAVWVHFVVRREPISSDDCSYFEYASGRSISGLHHKQRLVVVASTMLAQALFGLDLTAYYAVALFYAVGLVLVVYALARTLVGPLGALLSAGLLLGHPVFLTNASLLLPDIPSMFWFMLGLYFAVRGFSNDDTHWKAYALCAGGSLFLACSAKESTVTLLPGFILFPLVLSNRRGRWHFFVLLASTVFGLELLQTIGFWIATGDPLHRLHAVTGDHVQRMETYAKDPHAMPQHIGWKHLLTRFFERNERAQPFRSVSFLGLNYWTWFLISTGVSWLLCALRRDRLMLVLGGVMLVAFMTLTFTVISLHPLIPVVRTKPRYFLCVTVLWSVFSVCGIARSLAWLRSHGRRRLGAALTIAVAVATLLFITKYARALVTDARFLIRNGDTAVRDTGRALRRAVSRYHVEQIFGRSRPLRAGRIMWPWVRVPLSTLSGGRAHGRFHAGDLLVTNEAFQYWSRPDLAWRRIGGHRDLGFYFFEPWQAELKRGSLRIYVNDQRHLKKASHARRQRLKLELEAAAHGARPKALRFMVFTPRRRPAVRLLRWKRHGSRYSLEARTPSFVPGKIAGVALELVVTGGGSLELEKRKVSVVSASRKRH